MTEMPLWKREMDALEQALTRLNEALQFKQETNPLAIDATIQRFEFCIEHACKTLKRLIFDFEKTKTQSPRESAAVAFRLGWLENEDAWMNMLDDRNRTSHTYNEDKAHEVYARIPTHYHTMRSTYNALVERFGNPS
jgi:nucleotidyltransferase substrate binding protein (TIGR01987 family)